jgi:hypothetical protein
MTGDSGSTKTAHSRLMTDRSRQADTATYEIRVRGEVPTAVRDQFPAMSICCSPFETVLYRDVTDLAELDDLLEMLQSVGLVLSEIRESPPSATPDPGTSLEGGDDD